MENLCVSVSESKPPLNIPSGLDPDRHRIILVHYLGIDPAELRLKRLAEYLHALGPRPIFEFCRELAEAHDIGADMQRRLEKYARLDPVFVQALGGDCFASPPIYKVEP